MRRITLTAIAAIALLIAINGLAPSETHAQENPAQTLVGQQVTACKDDVRFRFAVASADWTDTIVDRSAAPGMMWVVAVTDVTNLGARVEYPQGLTGVRDDQDRESIWRLFNGEDLYVETDLAAQYGVKPSWEAFEPGIPEQTVLIFEVAADAGSLNLFANNLACTLSAIVDDGDISGPPTTPAVEPPVDHPASSLVGQSVTACKGELQFRFDVVDAQWRTAVVDRPARDTAMWAVVIADVTNLGPFADGGQGLAKVRDDQGREFSWRLFNGPDIYVEDVIAAEFGLRPSWDIFIPGITERTVLLFEVAGDARSLELLPDNIGCGG